MRLDDERESSNIEDQRGSGGGGGFGFPMGGGGFGLGGRGMGCGGIAVVIVLALVFGVNPLQLLGGGGEVVGPTAQIGQPRSATAPAASSENDRFVRRVLATTEDSWRTILPDQAGVQYRDPTLVLYSGTGRSACGTAQSAMGPFYCPGDQKLYLDQSFFDELGQKFGAPGDFAAAYVIAHEIGHHVQNLLGVLDQANAAQERGSKRDGNAVQVRVELQADCFAGVWANANKTLIEQGDVDEAMAAAAAVGDDRLQKQSQGVVIPDSFTHGSSAQRTRWFKRGLDSGRLDQCDTFRAETI